MSKTTSVLEKRFGVRLPERLRAFFDTDEAKSFAGARLWDVPFFSSDTTMKLSFGSGDLPELFDYAHEVFKAEPTTRLPIARAGKEDTYFVAVDTTQPSLPVFFFDYEGGFHALADSFDDFLGRVLKKGEQTPHERLTKAFERAKKLHQQDQDAKALALLEPVLASFPQRRTPTVLDESAAFFAEAINLVGLCQKGAGQREAALASFTRAFELGSKSAALNVCNDLLNTKKAYDELILYGEKLRPMCTRPLDDYAWYWVRVYLGYAYVVTGREADAVFTYHQLQDAYAEREPTKLEQLQKDLQEIVQQGLPHADVAQRIAAWLTVPPRLTLSDEARRDLSAWWASVPPKAQGALKKSAKLAGEALDDQALVQLSRLERVEVNRCELTDLSFCARLGDLKTLRADDNGLTNLDALAGCAGLTDLSVSGNRLTSLSGLEALTRLEKLDVGENQLTSLQGVEGLTRLEKLRAQSNRLTSIEPLAGLPSLADVTLYSNDIADFSPLGRCKSLEKLSCFDNDHVRGGLMALAVLPKFERVDEGVFPAKERSAFEEARRRQLTESPEVVAANRAWWEATVRASPKMLGLVHREISKAAKALGEDPKLAKKAPSDAVLAKALRLTSLHFGEMGLETLELVQPFRQADWLNLSHNAVADLTPLAELRGLRLLLLRHMGLTSLKPLAPLGAVRELQCNDNQLTSLEGLGGWRTLRELAAQNNPLRDLSALAELDLSILHLERTEVDSLEVLKTHRSLERLWIFGTKVTDLSPLASCPSLKELVCFSLPGLGGAMALTGLPRLRSIVSHQSLSADEVAAFRAARPDVRID